MPDDGALVASATPADKAEASPGSAADRVAAGEVMRLIEPCGRADLKQEGRRRPECAT
ncbi:MAG: hypothetical protein NUV77_20520 [Thermoguttaceae bacterium]|jgi:hypothetical protein|nr:hypothetical protein [Thermoguttaceae bacterium]